MSRQSAFKIQVLLLWVVLLGHVWSLNDTLSSKRDGKVLSLFQIVQFRNDICSSSGTRNGTCYTKEECTTKGGSSSGTCASGYGVCCVFSLSCGQTTSENCTYLVQDTTTATPPDPCIYTICPCDDNVCRIRFDFTSFSINGPVLGTADVSAAAITTSGGAIGDCTTDTFTITAPGNFAPPLICGFNSGQHMIVDACDGKCHEAKFGFGGSGTRMWDIKVTQFQCGDENGGPDGCLQYFTGLTGRVASFNFPTTTDTVSTSATHLSDQCYSMCWRQEENTCAICWIPVVLGSETVTGSFGLSVSAGNNNARGESDGKCRGDFLQIPDAQVDILSSTVDTFTIGSIGSNINLRDRVCGRFFSTAASGADRRASRSICTQQRPFRMTFKTDENERTFEAGSNNANVNELNRVPGGIVGFNLEWNLQPCP